MCLRSRAISRHVSAVKVGKPTGKTHARLLYPSPASRGGNRLKKKYPWYLSTTRNLISIQHFVLKKNRFEIKGHNGNYFEFNLVCWLIARDRGSEQLVAKQCLYKQHSTKELSGRENLNKIIRHSKRSSSLTIYHLYWESSGWSGREKCFFFTLDFFYFRVDRVELPNLFKRE